MKISFVTSSLYRLGAIAAVIGTLVLLPSCSHGRRIRTAEDVTPGNLKESELDWQYGANDIRIQTTKLTKILMDRWFEKTSLDSAQTKPRLIITEVSNLTNTYIPLDMVREIIESTAINDGRFTIVVGNAQDTEELNQLLQKTLNDPKYAPSSRPEAGQVKAPQLLGKIRLTMAETHQPRYDIQDWRMSITLYDVQTQEAIDSAYDVLRKKVKI